MKNTSQHSIRFYLLAICFFSILKVDFLYAGIIDKEQYSIQKEIRYKNKMTIAIIPFQFKLSSERSYLKDIIPRSIIKDILAYKRIRISKPVIDFIREERNVSVKGVSKNNAELYSIKDPVKEEQDKAFLSLTITEDDRFQKIAGRKGSDLNQLILRSGIDIVIKGRITQSDKLVTVDLVVYNNIYEKVFRINAEETFQNINHLLKKISQEALKAIIVDYAILNIKSDPSGAIVYIDKRYFGRTNQSGIILEAGHHRFLLKKDRTVDKRLVISLKKDSVKSIDVKLANIERLGNKKINITTSPHGAKIYFDSMFFGFSPLTLTDMEQGIYRIRVEKSGYITQYETLNVKYNTENEDENLNFTLRKGDSRNFYFVRSSIYYNMFYYSLLTSSAGFLSAFYFDLKRGDEKSKHGGSSDKIDKYTLYRDVSIYTAVSLLLSSAIFFYLDMAQYDIDIAINSSGSAYMSRTFSSRHSGNDRYVGLQFTLRL
ncbi:MAG: PEGA domain-containing protein [Spirochaetota bacterium]|nr:PEGA domain-containing protein [Spirochaetota bacterium]